MGFRFRKSVKIAPGVRMNFGKKSASVSFGGKGIRHTVSTTGRRTSTVGIPGSGLYYTKSTSSKKSNENRANSNTSYGTYDYEDSYQRVENFNNAIEYLTSLHKECDYNYNWDNISKEPVPFNPNEKGPNEIQAIKVLETYKPNIFEKIFKSKLEKKIKELESNVDIAKQNDENLYKDWKNQNELSKLILAGDLDAYMSLLKDIGFSSNLGGIVPSFNLHTSDKDMMIIEYDINIEDIIPDQYMTLTKTGKLSIRNYTKTAYYEIVKLYVCGFAIRIARNIFGLLPIENAIIHTNTTVLNTQTGKENNTTILSVNIDISTLNKLNFDLIDPFDALNNFQHNVKFLKTKGFQPVDKINI